MQQINFTAVIKVQNDSFITINNDAEIQYTEKKSVFIASAFTVQSEEDAQQKITAVRCKYNDATHHCYGYIIKGGVVKRFSDDNEPSGTAGMPILNVIEKSGITNTLVVVTRYFGGIKLGAGGLVRAYSASAAQALASAGRAVYVRGNRGIIEVDYDDFGAVERMLLQSGCIIKGKDFSNGVAISVETCGDWDKLSESVSDMCRGGAICEFSGYVYIKQ